MVWTLHQSLSLILQAKTAQNTRKIAENTGSAGGRMSVRNVLAAGPDDKRIRKLIRKGYKLSSIGTSEINGKRIHTLMR